LGIPVTSKTATGQPSPGDVLEDLPLLFPAEADTRISRVAKLNRPIPTNCGADQSGRQDAIHTSIISPCGGTGRTLLKRPISEHSDSNARRMRRIRQASCAARPRLRVATAYSDRSAHRPTFRATSCGSLAEDLDDHQATAAEVLGSAGHRSRSGRSRRR